MSYHCERMSYTVSKRRGEPERYATVTVEYRPLLNLNRNKRRSHDHQARKPRHSENRYGTWDKNFKEGRMNHTTPERHFAELAGVEL